MQGLILFSDSSRGVYIPEHFAESVKREYVKGVTNEDLDFFINEEPYSVDHFWDNWENILNNLTLEIDGYKYSLWHDGDLWLYCEDLMTENEKENFFYMN